MFIIIGSWHYTDWNEANLYRGYKVFEKVREPYYEADCIYLTGEKISAYTAYELQPYRSLTWIKAAKFKPQVLRDRAIGSKLAICIEAPDAQADAIFLELMKYLPEFVAKFKSPLYANHPDFERPGNIYYLDRVVN